MGSKFAQIENNGLGLNANLNGHSVFVILRTEGDLPLWLFWKKENGCEQLSQYFPR